MRRGISLVLAQRRDSQVDGLVLIRTVYLSFVSALVNTALVVTVVLGLPGDPETAEGVGLVSIVVVVVGLVSLFGFRRTAAVRSSAAMRRPWPRATDGPSS